MKITAKLWLGIIILIALSPLGLLLPAYFKAKGAWGEGGAGLWSVPMPDYAFRGWREKNLQHLSLAYLLSAILGVVAVVLAALIIGRILSKKGG